MRKGIAFLLVALLALSSFATVFAADAQAPADVKDTRYEAAVTALMGKGILSGYPDGTFRPEWTISRAEACTIVVKAMAPSEEALTKAAKSSFPDLEGYDWAAKYINYASAKGVISGYPGGAFIPSGQVTYAEMASMLVRALGYSAKDLTGEWPENFIVKAATLGIFVDIDHLVTNVNTSALRGHVALMANPVADQITEANKPGGTTDSGDGDMNQPGDNPAGFLTDYSGRAYGILLDTAKVVNADGKAVDEYEFLIGSSRLYLQTNGRVTADATAVIDGHLTDGDLYGLQLSGGIITKFGISDDGFLALSSPAGFEDFTDGTWAQVTDKSDYVIETAANLAGKTTFSVLSDASIYKAMVEGGVITGYEPANIRDVKVNSMVRMYSVTGDDPGVVEILLIKE